MPSNQNDTRSDSIQDMDGVEYEMFLDNAERSRAQGAEMLPGATVTEKLAEDFKHRFPDEEVPDSIYQIISRLSLANY